MKLTKESTRVATSRKAQPPGRGQPVQMAPIPIGRGAYLEIMAEPGHHYEAWINGENTSGGVFLGSGPNPDDLIRTLGELADAAQKGIQKIRQVG